MDMTTIFQLIIDTVSEEEILFLESIDFSVDLLLETLI